MSAAGLQISDRAGVEYMVAGAGGRDDDVDPVDVILDGIELERRASDQFGEPVGSLAAS